MGDALGDCDPHGVRSEYKRTMLTESRVHRSEERLVMDMVDGHAVVIVTALDAAEQSLERFMGTALRQQFGGGGHTIDRERHTWGLRCLLHGSPLIPRTRSRESCEIAGCAQWSAR